MILKNLFLQKEGFNLFTMSKYAAYFAIEKSLQQRGFSFERDELIEMFTEGKKSSLRELTATEYQRFLKWLNSNNDDAASFRMEFEKSDKQVANNQRRKIIALLTKLGYVTASNKADMPRIYAWVEKYGYLNKPMNQYNSAELPKLVYQAESFYKSHIERL